MRIGDNYVLFKTDVLFNDKVKIQGRELYFDPMFEPAKHVRTYGEVIQVPFRLRKKPIMQIPRGTPPYYDEAPFDYKWSSDIAMEVAVGDRIYFHFNTIIRMNFNIVKVIKEPITGKPIEWWFKVSYDQIICAVRQGMIIPIGSYTLVEPDMESIEEILIPIARMGADGKAMRDDAGRPIMKPKSEWLQKKVAPSAKYMRGWVRHVGTPLEGDICEVKKDQLVYYRPNADWTNVIEGKEYYAIRQRHIVGRVEN